MTEEDRAVVVSKPTRDIDLPATETVDGIAPDALAMLRFMGSTWSIAPAIDGYTGPLPGILAEIDRIIGRQLTLEFAKEFGGSRMAMPKRLRPEMRVVRAIGMDASRKLCEVYGDGLLMDIPLGPLSYSWMRSIAIRALLCEGSHSVEKISLYCRVNERTVY